MEKEFIPYELALKLKELGFDEPCLGFHFSNPKVTWYDQDATWEKRTNSELDVIYKNDSEICIAPLFQQTFDWFREKYNLDSWVYKYYDDEVEKELYRFNLKLGDFYSSFYNTYEKARQACLEKLIEIVENENRTH